MKSRILLKEIPNDKFDSAVLTTFSFNFYYFEQQVLNLLSSKGIHYISVLVDGNILDTQLDTLSSLSELKKRNYAIHGIQTKGAFHPKINFFAGKNSVLLLLGSGNLTSSGHGKNLESWNAIYIDNLTDSRLGFVKQCWSYLKYLHEGIGVSALQKCKTIEENCSLLSDEKQTDIRSSYSFGRNTSISFLATGNNTSLMKQISGLLTDDKIELITIMSPYYDKEGQLIHLLNKSFKPKKINIILQKDFGAPPISMKPGNNMRFYDWEDVNTMKHDQKYFHSKNIIFEGKKKNYLLSGSANASLAAFGTINYSSVNHEACVFYQEKGADFYKKLGIKISGKGSSLNDFKITNNIKSVHEGNERIVFLTAIEKSYDSIKVYYKSKTTKSAVSLGLFNTNEDLLYTFSTEILEGEHFFQIDISKISPLYGVFLNNSSNKFISNKQFVIDIDAFDSTNPSSKNKELNKIRNLLENGKFYSSRIIEYLNEFNKSKSKKTTSVGSSAEKKKDDSFEEEDNDALYMTYEEIQEKIKQFENKINPKVFTAYKSVRLWESIFVYLKDSKRKEEDEKIDDEETEDVNKSSGKKAKDKKVTKISKSTYDRMRDKVMKFLNDYTAVLNSKINSLDTEKPTLIDLSMYLIVMEILLHLLGYHEIIEDADKKASNDKRAQLIDIPLANSTGETWSEYVVKLMGLFTLWVSQKEGFMQIQSEEYKLKLQLYKNLAFKVSLNAMALFSVVNKLYPYEKILLWSNLNVLNAMKVFLSNNVLEVNQEEFVELIPPVTREFIGEPIIEDMRYDLLKYLNEFNNKHTMQGYFNHYSDGYTYVLKYIPDSPNKEVLFYKLIHPGYDWDDSDKNYSKNKVYNIFEKRWMAGLTTAHNN